MKTNMLIFILIIIVTCFSCSSNKKIVVEQIDSNYPIIYIFRSIPVHFPAAY